MQLYDAISGIRVYPTCSSHVPEAVRSRHWKLHLEILVEYGCNDWCCKNHHAVVQFLPENHVYALPQSFLLMPEYHHHPRDVPQPLDRIRNWNGCKLPQYRPHSNRLQLLFHASQPDY